MLSDNTLQPRLQESFICAILRGNELNDVLPRRPRFLNRSDELSEWHIRPLTSQRDNSANILRAKVACSRLLGDSELLTLWQLRQSMS